MLKPKKGFIQAQLNIDRLTPIQWDGIMKAMDAYAEHYHAEQYINPRPIISIPAISHFIDENGNYTDIGADGVNVILKKDGTHKYFISYGFAGVKQLTPIYITNIK